MTEVEQPPQNGIDLSAAEDDDSSKARPADIEQDMREMERRKRVEAIMSSKLFREELERIVDSAREGGTAGILQQLSDIVGIPASRVGNVYKASNCMLPINDIRGIESMGYAKGEKILRCKLAATFRLLDLYGWTQGLGAQITARLKVDQEYFLVNPYGLLYHEVTASSLNKVDMQGQIVEQGTTNFGVNKSHFMLHSVVHAARPDIRCIIYIGCSPVVAVSSLKTGLLPLTKDACVLGEVTTHPYTGTVLDAEERDKLVRNLGPVSKVLILANYGALCCGETIEEAFYAACHIVQACETQLKLLPVGLDNLVLIPEESRKVIYEQSRRPPEDLEKKFAAVSTTEDGGANAPEENKTVKATGSPPKWRVGGAEFEALMRMLDNAGYRTGYIYRHPLIKSDPPKPKNDVELPPAVSSLGYLLEEEELFKQGIWKKGDLRKGGDRTRWLNSPNVYQKVEVLETGTPDPKKITKWVAEGSPTHSTPVRIEDPLQFVPAGTNPKEFKRLQQQIKDNRRADKISAGPQSHILEGVTWDEANRIKDATVSATGDHVVLMGAASKGIIQRGYQHNATVYKAPYAKNPFDNVTDDELNEYKRTVERKKKSIHGEYTDTDFSESEPLSSLQTSGAQVVTKQITTTAGVSQSEPEDISEHQVMRIETQQAPVPSQPEVVLSDAHNNKISSIHRHRYSSVCNKENHLSYFYNDLLVREINLRLFAQKYAFLFERNTHKVISEIHSSVLVYTIYKIEIFPHYTYPLTNVSITKAVDTHRNDGAITNGSQLQLQASPLSSKNPKAPINSPASMTISEVQSHSQPQSEAQAQGLTQTSPPYRTVSHYGFNYPLTYLPTVVLHPQNLLSAVELQRQKVIEFINSTAMSFVDCGTITDASGGEEREILPDVVGLGMNQKALLAKVEDSCEQRCNSDSFVSVKEIQLESKGRFGHWCNSKPRTTSTATVPMPPQRRHSGDAISDQFSSMLSIGGSYPAASNTHSGDLIVDHDHHDNRHYDSGDNSSTFTVPLRHATSTNPYRSYVMRHFLPINHNRPINVDRHHQFSHCDHDHGEHDHLLMQHKPESEQVLHMDENGKDTSNATNNNNASLQHQQQQKQIKLTLKRRSSRSLATAVNDQGPQRHHDHDHSDHHHDHMVTACVSEAGGTSSSHTDSTTSVRSLEIHINISIKNSDCVKSLQKHENEFTTKLERVIDDEINLLSQQLAVQNPNKYESKSSLLQISTNLPSKVTERSLVAAGAHADGDADADCGDHNSELPTTPVDVRNGKRNKDSNEHATTEATIVSKRLQSALTLFNQKMEDFLNTIVQAHEVNHRSITCECKTQISQISKDLRASLSGTDKIED